MKMYEVMVYYGSDGYHIRVRCDIGDNGKGSGWQRLSDNRVVHHRGPRGSRTFYVIYKGSEYNANLLAATLKLAYKGLGVVRTVNYQNAVYLVKKLDVFELAKLFTKV